MEENSKTKTFQFKDTKVTFDLDKHFSKSWQSVLSPLFKTDYFKALLVFLHQIYSSSTAGCLQPKAENIFEPFKNTNPDNIKVVILGPSPSFSTSNGLLFGSDHPQALENVPLLKIHEKILCEGLNERNYLDTSLRDWEDQGVLMLNQRPLTHITMPAAYAEVFDYFTINVLNYLKELNPELVIAGVTPLTNTMINKVFGHDYEHKINAHGYINDRKEDISLYALINEKLFNVDEEDIKWISRV